MGVSSGSIYFYLGQDGVPTYFYGCESTGVGTVVAPQPRGFNIITTTASTFTNLYRNGVLLTTTTAASGATTASVIIGAFSNNGTPQQFYANQYAFTTIGTGLGATEQSTLSTIINTFQTTLSRNTY